MIYCKNCPWSGDMSETMKESWKGDHDHCPRCGAVIDSAHKPEPLLNALIFGVVDAPQAARDSFKGFWTEPVRGWDKDCK